MFIVASVSASFPAGGVFASPCWEPPVDAPIVDTFREPACRWCPGNRGIEFGTVDGDVVRTVATGEVARICAFMNFEHIGVANLSTSFLLMSI
jgi:hypothetical protein